MSSKQTAALIMMSGLLLAPVTFAADIRDRNIKVGIGVTEDHPQGQAVSKFAELVKEKSGGKLKVKLYAGGALGNDVTMISALQGGTQEMTVPEASTFVGIKGLEGFGLINLPFLFNNSQEADAVLDGPFGQKLAAKLPEKGLIGLGYWENGFRQVTNSRRAINKVEDFAGLKLRVIQNPLFIATFAELGANGIPMSFSEVYTALESRALDGQESTLVTTFFTKFYEVQKFGVISNHIYGVWMLLMSKKFWDKLTPDEQKILSEAGKEATAFERKVMRDADAKALEQLKSKGLQVATLPEAEVAKLREKMKPVWAKFTKEFGEANAKEMFAELEKARAAKK
jgi:tripartite ATP-independent transporter DctP family solute receptor